MEDGQNMEGCYEWIGDKNVFSPHTILRWLRT